jgi:hypothetical protein
MYKQYNEVNNMQNCNIIKPAINPIAGLKLTTGKILMDRTVLPYGTVTEEQKLNIKPVFS